MAGRLIFSDYQIEIEPQPSIARGSREPPWESQKCLGKSSGSPVSCRNPPHKNSIR